MIEINLTTNQMYAVNVSTPSLKFSSTDIAKDTLYSWRRLAFSRFIKDDNDDLRDAIEKLDRAIENS